MIDIEVELTAYHQVGCKTSNNSGANITYKCLHKTIQHNIEYEETYLQGYFEFRLCPHNTRRRPAQQARSKQSQNLKQTNTLNGKQENKINASIDSKHTNEQTLSCTFPFGGVTKEFLCKSAFKPLVNSLEQGCFDQHLLRREGGGVRFLPLPPEQVGSRSELVIKCDQGRLMMDTALKVLDEIPTS